MAESDGRDFDPRWHGLGQRLATWLIESRMDPESERAFEEHSRASALYWTRVVMVTVAVGNILFWPTDLFIFSFSPETMGRFGMVRAWLLVLTLGSLLVLDRSPFWRVRALQLLAIVLTVGTALVGYNYGALGGLELPWFYHINPVLCLTAVMVVPFFHRLLVDLAAGGAWSVAFFLFNPNNLKSPYLTTVLVFQAFVIVVVLLFGQFIYHLARRTFFQERRLEEQARILERQAKALAEEQAISERLLLNVLPPVVAEQLKGGQQPIAQGFDEVTVLFADLAGFTSLSQTMSPDTLVQMLNSIFSEFDSLSEKYGVEKIKTLGDAYMAAAGLPLGRPDHARAVVAMALEMIGRLKSVPLPHGGTVTIRIGVATGPVVAGVIGTKKFIYDLWGDTVNTASRLESHGIPGRVQVSRRTRDILEGQFEFEARGAITLKGLGVMDTWLVVGREEAGGSSGVAAP